MNLDNETWAPIPGNINYQVSNLGRIKSLPRKAAARFVKGGILKLTTHDSGYIIVNLAGGKTHRVNRLVANAFVPNPQSKPEVNHKDCDKSNNRADNLEWTTKKENAQHAMQHGVFATKLTADQVRAIRQMFLEGFSNSQVAERFSISTAHADRINRRVSWETLDLETEKANRAP